MSTAIVIVAKTWGPLVECALEAIDRTTPEPHAVYVVDRHPPMLTYDERDGAQANGAKLDYAISQIERKVATDVFVMHDDAAPLTRGWLTALQRMRGDWPWLAMHNTRSYGALFTLDFLRRQIRDGHTFRPVRGHDVGYDITAGEHGVELQSHGEPPWWLQRTDCAYDDFPGRLLYAHLGGASIGYTWHKGWRLYPRLPALLWPRMVRRHLRSQGC